jgi:hypothetical protein
MTMTIFSDHAGPLLQYQHGVLLIEDLNPQMKTRWRMSRRERFMVGLRFIASAMLQR